MLQAVSEVFVMFILVFLAMLVSEKPPQNGCDKLGMEKMRFSYDPNDLTAVYVASCF